MTNIHVILKNPNKSPVQFTDASGTKQTIAPRASWAGDLTEAQHDKMEAAQRPARQASAAGAAPEVMPLRIVDHYRMDSKGKRVELTPKPQTPPMAEAAKAKA